MSAVCSAKAGRVFWRLVGVVLLSMSLTGCGLAEFLGLKPPPAFPQLNEKPIAGPRSLSIPRWSPDGRSLAFMDFSRAELEVYDLSSKQTRSVASNISIISFAWHPANRVSYVRTHPSNSGLSLPSVDDLFLVDRDGRNNELVFENLLEETYFAWFQNGKQLVVLHATAESASPGKDIYLLDTETRREELLVSPEQLNVTKIVGMALAPNDSQLFIYAQREIGPFSRESWGFVYDLGMRRVVQELKLTGVFQRLVDNQSLREAFDAGNLRFLHVGQQNWIVGSLMATEGPCYNYAVFFLNLDDRSKSFCLPSVEEVIADVVLSPDLQRVAFVTAVGPGNNWIMVGDLTPEYRSRLEK